MKVVNIIQWLGVVYTKSAWYDQNVEFSGGCGSLRLLNDAISLEIVEHKPSISSQHELSDFHQHALDAVIPGPVG